MRQAKAGALDVVEEGEACSQGVDVNPEQIRGLELAARLGEHVSEFADGDEALGAYVRRRPRRRVADRRYVRARGG